MLLLESDLDWNPGIGKGELTVRGRQGARPADGRLSSARTCGCAAARPMRKRMRMRLRDFEARLDEAKGLAAAIELTVADALIAPIAQIRPATYLGKGKVEEITGLIAGPRHRARGGRLRAVADPAAQSREGLEHQGASTAPGLILEIFGRRAKTKEGALQVELAHLNYQRCRLVRSWTHLERQRGGFGFMGGPGETQIEADRRQIGDRIVRLENEIKKVQATRRLHREGRKRVPYRVVALVGYTNAGKSTLFNRLTRAEVQAADMLFATLDPTLRALRLPHGGKAMLSDTVGFISNLPTQLVAAFRATLEEVLEADVILHVRDISHEDAEAQERDVDAVLRQLGIDPDRRRPHHRDLEQDRPPRAGRAARICATSHRAAHRSIPVTSCRP